MSIFCCFFIAFITLIIPFSVFLSLFYKNNQVFLIIFAYLLILLFTFISFAFCYCTFLLQLIYFFFERLLLIQLAKNPEFDFVHTLLKAVVRRLIIYFFVLAHLNNPISLRKIILKKLKVIIHSHIEVCL